MKSLIEQAKKSNYVELDPNKLCRNIEFAMSEMSRRAVQSGYRPGDEVSGHVKGTGDCERVDIVAIYGGVVSEGVAWDLVLAAPHCCLARD